MRAALQRQRRSAQQHFRGRFSASIGKVGSKHGRRSTRLLLPEEVAHVMRMSVGRRQDRRCTSRGKIQSMTRGRPVVRKEVLVVRWTDEHVSEAATLETKPSFREISVTPRPRDREITLRRSSRLHRPSNLSSLSSSNCARPASMRGGGTRSAPSEAQSTRASALRSWISARRPVCCV